MAKGSIAAALSLVLLGACAYVPLEQRSGMNPVPAAATVRDDPMSTNVLVLSQRDEQPTGHVDVQRQDFQLVGAVQREDGAMVYAVRWTMRHRFGQWFFPRSATYLLAGGKPVQVQLVQVDRGNVEFCGAGGCTYEEGASFVVPAAVVEALADPAAGLTMRVRINGAGRAVEGILTPSLARTVVARAREQQVALQSIAKAVRP